LALRSAWRECWRNGATDDACNLELGKKTGAVCRWGGARSLTPDFDLINLYRAAL